MAEPITQVLGIVSIKNRGAYDSEAQYEKLNVVTYNGSSYCAKTSVQGILPTNTEYWDLMVSKGDTGEQGPKPVKGVDYYTEEDIEELEATIRNDVTTEVTSQLSELTSATPLVAATADDMTDTTRIYVLETDGHWYWNDGTDWQDGGVYQATEIQRDSINSDMITNLSFNKIDNDIKEKSISLSDFTNLTNCTVSEDTNTITVTRTSTTSDAKFRINFSFDNINKDTHLIFTLSNLKCYPTINIATSSNKNLRTMTLNNGKSYFILEAADVKATTTFEFKVKANEFGSVGNGGTILTISKSYNLTNSSTYNFDSDTVLSDYINNLTSYDGITDRKKYLDFNFPYGSTAGFNELTRNGNNYKAVTTSTNRGIRVYQEQYETSSYLHVKGNVDNNSDNDVNVILIAYEADETAHYNSLSFSPGQEINATFDLSYYAVYQNMVKWVILVNHTQTGTMLVNNLTAYIDDLSDLNIYDVNLGGVIRKIQNNLDGLDSKIAQSGNVVVSPNNSKFRIVVDNNGNLSTLPMEVYPQKALFIGNSLLLGFVTHGMASYSVNDDYYYYINDYLTNINSNYTASRVSGTAWESATNSTATNTFINDVVVPNMTQDTNIVFIQLGDNCNTTARQDYIPVKGSALINAIRNINPGAMIYWIGCWYNSTARQTKLVELCNQFNIKYINIAPLRSTATQAYIGYEYIDKNGVTQTITSSGVAGHPSSVGMEAIANYVIDNIDLLS